MARPRKPTAVLELNGAFKHNPHRALERANEPQPDGPLEEAPAFLSVPERREWRRVKKVAPWVTIADEVNVMIVCKLTVKLKTNTLETREIPMLMKALTELGMTPASRSRVQAAPKKQETKKDSWSEFAVTRERIPQPSGSAGLMN